MVMRGGKLGIEHDGALKFSDCLIVLPLLRQKRAEGVVQCCVVGRFLKGALNLSSCRGGVSGCVEGRCPGNDLVRSERRGGLGVSEQVKHFRRAGKVAQLRPGHGEIKNCCVVGGLEVVGDLQFLYGLAELAFGEQNGAEGAVRGGNVGLELHEFGEFRVGRGEVVAGIGGRAGAEGGVGSAEVLFGDGGVCVGGRLAVSREGRCRNVYAEQQRGCVQGSHISDYCNSHA